MLASIAPPSACAEPPRAIPVPPTIIAQGESGGARFTVETAAPSITTGDPFAFTVIARVPRRTDSVSIRFQLKHPGGRLIFQRTRVVNEPEGRTISEAFERETADLSLRPGIYPITIDASARSGGRARAVTLESSLLVTGADSPVVPVVLAARVFGQPLADPQGRFVSDPGTFTRARDEISQLSRWVLSDSRARITLSVPPLLVEEWSRIAGGYDLAGPEGVESHAEDSPAALEYARTITELREAMATGRLELVATGYADPDLFELETAGLAQDVLAHYERGRSALFSSLETSPSTGTIPAGGCIPAGSVESLEDAGVEYVIVDAECLESDGATLPPGSYRVTNSELIAIAADPEASRALASSDASAFVGIAFDRAISGDPSALAAVIDLGPGAASADRLIAVAVALRQYHFVTQRSGHEAAARPRRVATLTMRAMRSSAPRGYWAEVADSRRRAGALLAATGESAAEAVTAERNSLIAASSAWVGTDGAWVLADRGRGFASAARRLSEDILSVVSVSVQPVTLAGTAGELPLTVSNDSDRTLQVRLVAEALGGGVLTGPDEIELTLEPQDTFVQVPIDLSNAVAGEVRIALLAGEVELDAKTVSVRASYLDRVAIMAVVVIAMIGFLVFIARRVRAQDCVSDVETPPERYTEKVMRECAPPRTRDEAPPERGAR